jgi:uncharacterized phage protein gp47/JayE
MINIQVTDAGFERDTLETILANLTDEAELIFGDDIDLSPSTQDAELLGVFAEAIDDTAQAVEDVYNGRNPDVATGQNLRSVCCINNVDVILGSFSFVNLTAVITTGAVVPAGTLVQDVDTGATYAFDVDTTGVGTSQTVSCTATEEGAVSAPGKVTQIVTPTYGLISVTNPSASTPATAEETDEQLRLRRGQSTAMPTQALVDGVRASLLTVPAVGKMKLWENSCGTYVDAKPGDLILPPHSISVVVTSGAAAAIGLAIFQRKSLGCTTAGDQLVVVSDTYGNPVDIYYRYAAPVRSYLTINYKERPGQGFGAGGGEDGVKAAVAAWVTTNQQPGADILTSHLMVPALLAVTGIDGLPAFAIEDLLIGRAADAKVSADLALAFNELATVDAADIVMVAV